MRAIEAAEGCKGSHVDVDGDVIENGQGEAKSRLGSREYILRMLLDRRRQVCVPVVARQMVKREKASRGSMAAFGKST